MSQFTKEEKKLLEVLLLNERNLIVANNQHMEGSAEYSSHVKQTMSGFYNSKVKLIDSTLKKVSYELVAQN